MEKFKAGDVFRLKSGGPLMTVEATEPNPYGGDSDTATENLRAEHVGCAWFGKMSLDGEQEYDWPLHREVFPEAGIRQATDQELKASGLT